MNDNSSQSQHAGSSESAFGHPANWRTAGPALFVGLVAFLLALYGTFWLPPKLPAIYLQALKESQQEYQQAAEKFPTNGNRRLIDAAGDLDVIYSRLVSLEKNSASRYWEWAEFQQEHANRLQTALKDPALSLSPSVQHDWQEQAQHFQTKSSEILEQLTNRPSEFKARALLQVAQKRYQNGLAEFGVREAAKLADDLHEEIKQFDDAARNAATLSPAEVDAARLLVVQLQIEAAWQTQPRSNLAADPQRLEIAWKLLESYVAERPELGEVSEWRASIKMLSILTGRDFRNSETSNSNPVDRPRISDLGWQQQLAMLQLLAMDGAWTDLTDQFRARLEPADPAVTSGLARTIFRLAVSPVILADSPIAATVPDETLAGEELSLTPQEPLRQAGQISQSPSATQYEAHPPEQNGTSTDTWAGEWAAQSDTGLLLAAQLGMHLPECSELMWELARKQAGKAHERTSPSEKILQAIMSSPNGWLKHTLAAISATLDEQPAVARTHLQLLGRMRGSPSLVARVALWRAQLFSVGQANAASNPPSALDPNSAKELKELSELLGEVVRMEPNSGLNWFVLGTLQYKSGELTDMRTSLTKARELLGDIPAIEQMLEE